MKECYYKFNEKDLSSIKNKLISLGLKSIKQFSKYISKNNNYIYICNNKFSIENKFFCQSKANYYFQTNEYDNFINFIKDNLIKSELY